MDKLFQFKKHVKGILALLEKTLSPSAFNAFYSFAFPKYKALVKTIYRGKSIVYMLSGNSEGLEMVRRIHAIMPYTLVGTGGLETTYMLAKLMNKSGIKGNFVELGVARGGCAALMAGVAFEDGTDTERRMWLFDSFEGLPEPTEDDFAEEGHRKTGDHVRPLPKGSCLGPFEEVKDLMLNKQGFPPDMVIFVKGWVQNTLPLRGADVGEIAILRIDVDWYESTKCCLEHLYDQVVSGGAVIVDDYESCFGCKKAVDEFVSSQSLNVDIIFDGRGGCYFIKP